MRFTVLPTKKMLFEMHYRRRLLSVEANKFNIQPTFPSNEDNPCRSQNSTKFPVYNMRDRNENSTEHLILEREKVASQFILKIVRED